MGTSEYLCHCVKHVCIRSYSGPYFPAFELNTEIYSVNLRIQSECWKIRTRKNSVFGYFSHSASSWSWISIRIVICKKNKMERSTNTLLFQKWYGIGLQRKFDNTIDSIAAIIIKSYDSSTTSIRCCQKILRRRQNLKKSLYLQIKHPV